MSTLAPRPLRATFLPSVNALLAALALPFAIDHPTDLTPSLLLAIFESLISARLPIPSAVRQSRTRDAKARAMLVLLGVLECDVLRGGTSSDADHSIAASNVDDSVLGGAGGVSVDGWVDEIGLGEVDPEQLADGGWEETIFVGELLCWLARRRGILPRTKSAHRHSQRSLYSNHHSYGTEEGEGNTADFSTSLLLRPSSSQTSRSPRLRSPSAFIDNTDAATEADFSALSHITDIPRHPLVHSPEPSISASATTGTDLSIRARSVSSRTSVSNPHDDPDEFEEASQDTVQAYDPRRMIQDAEEDDDQPPTFRPRCIHELEDPSYLSALAGPSSSLATEDEEQYNDDPDMPPTPTPRRVRLTGWIETVDSATELSQFAASRTHSRSHAFNATTSSGMGPPSRSQPHEHAFRSESSRTQTEVPSRPLGKLRIPRPVSPSPSPPPSPPPSTSSKHPLTRLSLSPPPSSPSPENSDPPFDVSFATFNNTSTPAKPRPPRRPKTAARHPITLNVPAGGGTTHLHRPDRSPSYTPSPPSFSGPGNRRNGTGGNMGAGPTGSAGPTPRASRNASAGRTILATSPPPVALGSTTTTNTLLTERARLLTELAALKRARAASQSQAGGSGVSAGSRADAIVGRRVGVEVMR